MLEHAPKLRNTHKSRDPRPLVGGMNIPNDLSWVLSPPSLNRSSFVGQFCGLVKL